MRIFLIMLMTCGMALAADPEATPTPGDIAVVVPSGQQQPEFHVDVEQQLRQWVRLSQSIDHLQKTIDQLTEEVEMFSQQLAEQINASVKVEPTPSPAPTPGR